MRVRLGLTFFIQVGLFPIDKNMAGVLTQKESLFWLLTFAFLLGFGTTEAELALIPVSAEVAPAHFLPPGAKSKTDHLFGLNMYDAFSVGVAILLGVFHIFKGWPVH